MAITFSGATISGGVGLSGPPLTYLYAWGAGASAGLNTSVSFSSPTQVGTAVLNDWTVVSGAGGTSGTGIVAGVRGDGTLWSWGTGNFYGTAFNDRNFRSSPTQVGTLTTWLSAYGAYVNGFAVKTDGTLWGWGANASGQLGQNNVIARSSPVQIGGLTNWTGKIAGGAGSNAVVAVKSDGTLWSWGYGGSGIGLGDYISRSSPTQVGSGTTWLNAWGTAYTFFMTKTDGTLWVFGGGGFGQTGLNGNPPGSPNSPVQVGTLTNWSSAASSQYQGFLLRNDGTIWSMGNNTTTQSGATGQNNSGTTTNLSSPTQIGSLTTWTSIGNFIAGGIATRSDNTIWAWGQNNGMLGDGTVIARSSPVQVNGGATWTNSTVFAGGDTSFIIQLR